MLEIGRQPPQVILKIGTQIFQVMLGEEKQSLLVMLEMCNQPLQFNASHMSDISPTYSSHVGDVQPGTSSDVGGIDYVEKPRWIGHNPKFPCNLCKGDHLTHLCPGLPKERRLWSLSTISYDSDSYEVSSQPIHPLVDEVVMSMKYSSDPTPILGGDAPSYHVVSQPIQLVVEEVVVSMQSSVNPPLLLDSFESTKVFMLMQSSVDPTLLLESVQSTKVVTPMQSSVDPTLLLESFKSTKVVTSMQYFLDPTLLMGTNVCTNYVFNISNSVLSEQGGILLTLITPSPSPRMVLFYWNDLVDPHRPSSTPFQIRIEVNSKNIYRCVVDEGSSTSILSSSDWKSLGSPELVSHELLAFDRHPNKYLGIVP
jgi:hypothetical protein